MQEARHTAEQVRYLYGTPQGILEFRSFFTENARIDTLLVHLPACDGEQCALFDYECDAESADDLRLYWLAGGDEGIWYGLAEYAVNREAAEQSHTEHEPSHEQRAFRGQLIAEGRRMSTNPNYFA
ncbi:hypothetical protein AB0K35_27825 [Micromonospora sp. NPDC053740]|uniref:hypothetical protein n=1 Tax=Micromonospora sp. NPDC053740 TaxID=3155173 RepID=UPI003419A24B